MRCPNSMAVWLLLSVAVVVQAADDAADKSFMGKTALSSGYFDENAAIGAPDGDAEGEVDDVDGVTDGDVEDDDVGGVTDEDAEEGEVDDVDGVTDGDAEGEVDDVGAVTDGDAEEGEVDDLGEGNIDERDGDSTQTNSDSVSGSKIRKLSVNQRRCVPSSDEHCVSYYMWATRPYYKFQAYAFSKNGVWLELHGHSQLSHWYGRKSIRVFSQNKSDLWLVTVKIPYAKLDLMSSYFLTSLKVKVTSLPERRKIHFHPNPKNIDGTFSPMQEDTWGDCSIRQMFRALEHNWAKTICKHVNKGYFGKGTFNLRPHTRTSFSYVLNSAPYSEGGWTCAIGQPTVSTVRKHHCGAASLCHDVHKLTDHSTVACIMLEHCLKKSGNNAQHCHGLGWSRQRQLLDGRASGRKDVEQHAAPKKRQLQLFMLTWGIVEAGEALAALVSQNILVDFGEVGFQTVLNDLGGDAFDVSWEEHFMTRGVAQEYGANGFWENLSNLQRIPGMYRPGRSIGDAIDVIGRMSNRPLMDALARAVTPELG